MTDEAGDKINAGIPIEADSPTEAGGRPAPEAGPGHPIQLLLLRHADAGDPAAWTGEDALRPLSGKGRRQARWVGRWLATQRRPPDVVVTSPKLRAAETASLAARSSRTKPVVDERLASGFDVESLGSLIRDHAPEARRILLVGHDPDFSELASALVGGSVSLRKGAVARIDLAGPVERGAGTLRWIVPAEALFEE